MNLLKPLVGTIAPVLGTFGKTIGSGVKGIFSGIFGNLKIVLIAALLSLSVAFWGYTQYQGKAKAESALEASQAALVEAQKNQRIAVELGDLQQITIQTNLDVKHKVDLKTESKLNTLESEQQDCLEQEVSDALYQNLNR